MPRNKTSAAQELADSEAGSIDNHKQISTETGQFIAAREQQIAAVEQRYDLSMPYDYERYIAVGRECVVVAAERMFVLGRVLIGLKEHEEHGAFSSALERIGVAPRFARKCMASAIKFDGSDAKKLVGAKLSQSKLLELLAEDDDDIEALGDGGTLAGLSLDDIDRMTRDELRKALREARQEKEAAIETRDETIARKEKQIADLRQKVSGIKRKPARDRALLALQELEPLTVELVALAGRVREAIDAVFDAYDGEDLDLEIQQRLRAAAEAIAELPAGLEHLTNG